MRLIDADALLDSMPIGCFWDGEDINMTLREIDNAPTVDAVKVVRCKDCKFSIVARSMPLTKWCNAHAMIVGDSDFCSRGKGKQEHES